MSRSRKKVSIRGNGGDSDKFGKKIAHKKFRQAERQAIHHEEDPPIDSREVEDCWSWSKDGKKYFDEEEHPEDMRK